MARTGEVVRQKIKFEDGIASTCVLLCLVLLAFKSMPAACCSVSLDALTAPSTPKDQTLPTAKTRGNEFGSLLSSGRSSFMNINRGILSSKDEQNGVTVVQQTRAGARRLLEQNTKTVTSHFNEKSSLKYSSLKEHTIEHRNTSDMYLGFVTIDEQLSSNTEKFVQLSYFSALWNLSMIEPWIEGSSNHLSSVPPPASKQTLLFFDIYNKTRVERRLTQCFNEYLPPAQRKDFHFHSLNDALIHSSRDVLIVRFMKQKWSHAKEVGDCSNTSGATLLMQQVQKVLNSIVLKVKDEAQAARGVNFTFKAWRAVCITAIPRVPFSIQQATEFIQSQLEAKQRLTGTGATVVISLWMKVKNTSSRDYYYDPTFKFSPSYCGVETLPFSDLVLTAADRMQASLKLSQPYIGVYARTERMGWGERGRSGFIDRCLHKFLQVLIYVEKVFNISRSKIVLVHDAGPYGSNTFDPALQQRSAYILHKFQALKLRTVHYDPKQYKDLPQDRAFAAAVEQEFLSRSHALVAMGGGGVMRHTVGHFMAKHSPNRTYLLCYDNGSPDTLPNDLTLHLDTGSVWLPWPMYMYFFPFLFLLLFFLMFSYYKHCASIRVFYFILFLSILSLVSLVTSALYL